jgi:predicted Zn-ribbon and HTH transcriptional regulator
MSNDRYEETIDALAHEIWAVAQLAPGEGIVDGVARIASLLRREAHPAITHCDNCGCDWLDNGLNPVGCPYCKQSAEAKILVAERDALEAENERLREALKDANDEVVFIDGVGAGRSSIKSCRDGVQWIVVGDRVYWPLSDSDAKRLQSACCGNGHFDGPATPTSEGESND